MQKDYHRHFLKIRNVNNLIQSDEFKEAYNKASEEMKKLIKLIFYDPNIKILRTWVKYVNEESLFDCTYIELRDTARKLGIKNYATQSKKDLILTIEDKGFNIHVSRFKRILNWFTQLNEKLSACGRDTQTPSKNKSR